VFLFSLLIALDSEQQLVALPDGFFSTGLTLAYWGTGTLTGEKQAMTHSSLKGEFFDVFYDPNRKALASPTGQPVLIRAACSIAPFPGANGLSEGGHWVPYPASRLSSALAKAQASMWLQQCSLLSL